MAQLVLRPNAVGFYSAGSRIPWAANGGFTLWDALNEANEDGDTSYVYADDVGPFTVLLEDVATGSFVRPVRIASATVVATVRLNGATPAKFKFRLRHLGVDYDSPEYEVTSASYVEVEHIYYQLPSGFAWSSTRLNEAELGLVFVEGDELRCTKLELQVHTEPYTHQTLVPSDVTAAVDHQQWDNFPGTASAHMSVGRFDGDGSYIHSSTLWEQLETRLGTPLYDVYGFATDDVYAVGAFGAIRHWDGTEWSIIDLGIVTDLFTVWGSSATDVFIAGDVGLIMHWDGFTWSAQASGVVGVLNGLWGSSSADVFAVGVAGTIIHYNGAVWAAQVSGTVNALSSVWGAASNQVFATGVGGTILFYDGVSWAAQVSGTALNLNDAWGTAVNDVYTVGVAGTILHYDGIGWSAQTSGTLKELWGVWGDGGTGDVLAVGDDGTVRRLESATWIEQPTYLDTDLRSVWGTLATNVFVVGFSGLALRFNAPAWYPISVFKLSDLQTPLTPPNLDKIQVSVLVKNEGAQDAQAAVVVRSIGVDYRGAHGTGGWTIPADGVWHLIEEEFLNDPSTGWPSGAPAYTPWNTAEADLLEAGVQNLGGDLRCTTVAAETFQKHTPLAVADLFPTSDGYHQDLPALVPGGGEDPWEDIDEDPPDYAVSYIGADADAADTNLYGSFGVGPAFGPFPAGEQCYAVELRLTLRLGAATTIAMVAPILRYNNETVIGRTFPISNTGTDWFDVKQDFYTSPFTGVPWTDAEINATEYGMVVLQGEAFLTRLRVQVQNAPAAVTTTPDATTMSLTDAAIFYINRSKGDGTIYFPRSFAVGTGGFNPLTPTTVLPVNTADVALSNEIYRDRVQRITYDTTNYPIDPWEVTYWCRVPRTAAVNVVGEVALFAEILWSPIPAEIGTWFMYALLHMPCQCRHPNTVHLYKLKVEYP